MGIQPLQPNSGAARLQPSNAREVSTSGRIKAVAGQRFHSLAAAFKNKARSVPSLLTRMVKVVAPAVTLQSQKPVQGEKSSEGAAVANTLKELCFYGNASQAGVVLSRTRSMESLNEACDKLSDKDFHACKDAILDRMKELEADVHVKNFMAMGADPNNIAKSLCQHREFIAKTAAHAFFSDNANYVKSHLLPADDKGAVRILARFQGCGAQDFRLQQADMDASGINPALRKAEKQGVEALFLARKKATPVLREHLDKHSPGKAENIIFMSQMSDDVSKLVEAKLLEQLGPADHDTVVGEMSRLAGRSVSINIAGKSKTLPELQGKMKSFYESKKRTDADAREFLKAVFGKQKINSDVLCLARMVSGSTNPGKRVLRVAEQEIMKASAQQLVAALDKKAQELGGASIAISAPFTRKLLASVRELNMTG